MSDHFAQEWLRLRESADLAARDPGLMRQFIAALPPSRPLRVIDLGAGTGGNARALLPRITGNQHWLLIDRDRDLLAAQAEEFTVWARRQGYPVSAGGGHIIINARPARWQIEAVPLDLAKDLASLGEITADCLTASAFFDLVSAPWLEALVALIAQRRWPLLAALTEDGRREWRPPDERDAIVGEAFARHQRRDKGFGPALGGTAAAMFESLLADAAFSVGQQASDWRLGARDGALLEALLAGEARAAVEAAADATVPITAWQTARHEMLSNDQLEVTIGHCDILALPA